ncbi:cytochrome P450 oxidoreductase [Apiospora kogelbergensis]|uniref:Cytochrome P450 oxidoreductase n=1 Tax=Apiospora kogelbergensis TaxID=1337665 RepID=A0AAW0R9T5_9PEZI
MTNNVIVADMASKLVMTTSNSPIVSGFALAISTLMFLLLACIALGYGHRGANYPPGPPTKLILGNALDFPNDYLQYKFSEWARKYGDVVSLKVFHQTIISINSPSLMRELLERRSVTSSNRPKNTLTEIITPGDLNMGTAHLPDDTWKAMRRAAQNMFSSKNLGRTQHVQHAEATQMVMDIIIDPDNWMPHTKRYVTSFLLSIMYGFRAARHSSLPVRDLVAVHRRFVDILGFGGAPPVDLFPVLKLVPKRFAYWKRETEDVGRCQQALFKGWMDRVRARLDRGETTGCFLEDAVRDLEGWGMKDDNWLDHMAGSLVEASDTVPVTICSFIICCVKYPEKTALAAAEIDRVIGPDKVPRLSDLESGKLPYTRAMIDESMRMYPVAPVGIPHEMAEDDVVDGVLYSKGAVVFQNTWFMFRDERYFDRPHEFRPERFLENPPFGTRPGVVDDPARRDTLLWGSGRRICPGQLTARTSIDTICPYLLWAFDFKRGVDPVTGQEAGEPEFVFEKGIVAVPAEVPCKLVPRSKQHIATVQREFGRVAEDLARHELEIDSEDAAWNREYRDVHVL